MTGWLRRKSELFFLLFCLSGSSLLLFPGFLDKSSCSQCRGICHVEAKEKKQCLAEAVPGCDASHSVVLFLIAEAALHYRGTQVSEDSLCGVIIGSLILWPWAFANKAGRNSVFRAVPAGFIICIDGVSSEAFDLYACQFLMILNTLLYAYSLVEGFKRVVFDEGYAVYLNVVDLGSELHALVLLASDYGANIWAVDTDYAVLDFLMVEVVGLLSEYFVYGHQTAFLLRGQINVGLELTAKEVPLR